MTTTAATTPTTGHVYPRGFYGPIRVGDTYADEPPAPAAPPADTRTPYEKWVDDMKQIYRWKTPEEAAAWLAKNSGRYPYPVTYSSGNTVDLFGNKETIHQAPKPGDYGYLATDGESIPIYVPPTATVSDGKVTAYDAADDGWTDVNDQAASKMTWDWGTFFAGISLGDMKKGAVSTADNKSLLAGPTGSAVMSGAGTFASVVGAAANAQDMGKITAVTQVDADGNKRVILEVGNSDGNSAIANYADGVPHDTYWTNAGDVDAQQYYSSGAKALYTKLTGKKLGLLDAGSYKLTIDPLHKTDPSLYYLWQDKNGVWMESMIIYPGDKMTVGGVFSSDRVDVPLGGSWPVSDDNQKLLNIWMDKYGQ